MMVDHLTSITSQSKLTTCPFDSLYRHHPKVYCSVLPLFYTSHQRQKNQSSTAFYPLHQSDNRTMVSSFAELAHDDNNSERSQSHSSSHSNSGGSVASYATSMAESTRHTSESKRSNKEGSSQQEYAFAEKMTRVVGRWRTCVILMLLVTAALVVTSTYLFLSDNEEKEFQKSVCYYVCCFGMIVIVVLQYQYNIECGLSVPLAYLIFIVIPNSLIDFLPNYKNSALHSLKRAPNRSRIRSSFTQPRPSKPLKRSPTVWPRKLSRPTLPGPFSRRITLKSKRHMLD